MPDAIFADELLAQLYDPFDPDRSDLDSYAAIVHELGATQVRVAANLKRRSHPPDSDPPVVLLPA